ncbi:unnamed protein product [Candidula unifasciata]|uniref:C2H2-type domain-containing protein n=1 Tax=Candidula unifasciata TaxID=100452 RepID=A0A8S3Z156_9EUPU|nr:unnamed protein product [Candidula unifasciata]
MATTVTNRNYLFETFSASGTVYLTLDNQLAYRQRFHHHVQVNIIYDHTGTPVPAIENTPSTGRVSDAFMDYSSEGCGGFVTSTYHKPILHDEHIKLAASSDSVNNTIQFNFSDQGPSASTVVEAFDCVKDSVSELLLCQDTLVAEAHNTVSVRTQSNDSVGAQNSESVRAQNSESVRAPKNDSIRADAGNVDVSDDTVDVSETEVECQPECVSGQKSVTVDDDNSVRESQLEDGKLTSKRLSRLSLKISRQPTSLIQKNFRNKPHEVKINEGEIRAKKRRVKIEHTDQEPARRSLARLRRTSEKLVKKTEEKLSAKVKIKNRDTVNRQRESKIRKLELEKEVKCEYCLQVFKSQQEYFDHRKGDRKSFECKICGKVIPFKAHLLVHMKKHDNSLEEAFLPLKEIGKTEAQNSEIKPRADSGDYRDSKHIKCDMCGLTVSNIPILKTHMMIHTGEFAYKCCVCGEKTHSIAKQSSHMATHLKSGKVQCKICNIRFETRSDLSRHQLSHEFKCSICGKVFPNKTSRVFHYKMAHKEEILRCEVCGKLFSSEEELAPHLKYHRNRAKTQCTICGLFVTRLDNHILSHSMRSEDSKMYICDQCPKQFKQKLSFQRHLRTHSEEKPYACMECPKRFARSGGLRRHMITHTQEKPFVCSICGKACSQMGNLRIHMQIHKGCSLVQCKLCGENFPYKNNLQEHMETTHFVDPEMSSQDPSRNTANAAQMNMASREYEGIVYVKDNVCGTVYLTADSYGPININFFHNIRVKVVIGSIKPECQLQNLYPPHGLNKPLNSVNTTVTTSKERGLSEHNNDLVTEVTSNSEGNRLQASEDDEGEEYNELPVEDTDMSVSVFRVPLKNQSSREIEGSLSCSKKTPASELQHPCSNDVAQDVSVGQRSTVRILRYKKGKSCEPKNKKTQKNTRKKMCGIEAEVDKSNKFICSEDNSYSRQTVKLETKQLKEKHSAKWKLACSVTCQYCLKVFENQQSYYDHKKTLRSGTYECDMCTKVFPFQAHLQAHTRAYHQEEKHVSNLKESASCVCDVCGSEVKNMFALKKHLMVHTQEYFYKCCICGKQFVEPGTLNNHMTSHKSGGMIRCKCCDQLFATRGALAKHKLASMEVKCHLCGQVFPNRTSRTQHYKVCHLDDILKCCKCTSMFSSAEELSVHMKKHNTYKKKQCPTCGKYFSRLEKHIIVHKAKAEIDDSELFVCDKCPKKFTNRSSFQRHLTIHSQDKPYQCPSCPKKFADCGVLRKHLRRHLSLMPYECEVCGKKCKEPGNLKVHMRVHSDIKQFQCPLCPQAFNYKSSLDGHKRSRHCHSVAQEDTLPRAPEVRQEPENSGEPNLHRVYRTAQVDSGVSQLCQHSSWKVDHQAFTGGCSVDMKHLYETRANVSVKPGYDVDSVDLMARHTYHVSAMHLDPVCMDLATKHTCVEDSPGVPSKHTYIENLNITSGNMASIYARGASTGIGASSQPQEESSLNVTTLNMSSMNIMLDEADMDESLRKNQCFESKAASGAVIYVIDNDAPVCLQFSSFIKIEVVFDSFSHCTTTVAEGCDTVEGALTTVKTEASAVAEAVFVDAAEDLKSPGHDDVRGSDNTHAEDSLGSIAETSELAAKTPRKRRVKRDKSFGRLDSATSFKIVKRNHMETVKQKLCSGNTDELRGGDGKSSECVREGGPVCCNADGATDSDLHDQAFNKTLRSSNRLMKLNIKSHTGVQASKAAKTFLKSTSRKGTKKSKKHLVNQTRSPAKESPEHAGTPSQVKERPRKLLMDKGVKCEYCAGDFHNQQAFYDHRRAQESTHKCGICGKVEPYEAHLIVHMLKHRQKMKCSLCGLVVSSMDSLKIHTFLHTGEYAYRCCVCGEHFSSLSSRQHHMDIHISAQRFKCNPCGERFTSRADLAKHQLTHEIKCALCGEVFPNKTSRTCHFRVSHPSDILKCSLCSNLFATVEDLEKHLTYHKKGKKEQCPVCGVVVSKLKDHMLMHSQVAQEKLYACDQCPMRYLRKSNLDRHMRTHTGEKPYACNRCPKSFRSNGMLRKHLLTHTKERPYQCEVCGKQCSLRSNLNIHMRVHNNDRSFCCPFCPQAFNHKNSLHGHMKNKHAQDIDPQERKLNISIHSAEMPAPNMCADIHKTVSFDHKTFQQLAIPGDISTNIDPDLLKIGKLDDHPDFGLVHSQLNFPMNKPQGITANMLLLGERYEMHSQGSHNHSY